MVNYKKIDSPSRVYWTMICLLSYCLLWLKNFNLKILDVTMLLWPLFQELGLGPSIPVHAVLNDWIRHTDGKLSFLGFVKLLHGVSSRIMTKTQWSHTTQALRKDRFFSMLFYQTNAWESTLTTIIDWFSKVKISVKCGSRQPSSTQTLSVHSRQFFERSQPVKKLQVLLFVNSKAMRVNIGIAGVKL